MTTPPRTRSLLRGLALALTLLSLTAACSADAAPNAKLLAPEKATAKAPDLFKVKFTTTKGDFVVEVHRDWAPLGADRFFNLVKLGYYDDVAFFRAIDNFMVQFGINGSGDVNTKWNAAHIDDDPAAGQTNARGMLTFATSGPNSRTSQLFINYKDNGNLDGMGFRPFGKIVSGMEVVDSLYKGYGEGAPRGRGPRQDLAQAQGNAYFKKEFPLLDYVKKARVEK